MNIYDSTQYVFNARKRLGIISLISIVQEQPSLLNWMVVDTMNQRRKRQMQSERQYWKVWEYVCYGSAI